MTSERDQQIRALYRAALERPAAERASFVAELSGGDSELRASVEALLSRQDATDAGPRSADDLASELAPGTRLGQYRIDGVLARGGMGVVYRATDTKLERPVAIKFLSNAAADADARRRFEQEARTASSLNHPHIVTLYDVGEADGRQYIVSELIDGGTLDDWATAARHRTWRQSVELLTGVADGLAAAHAAGVLHRDVKPGNILIGANGYAKLADFGLAKLVRTVAHGSPGRAPGATRHTREGVVVGTVAYMSPEQAAGLPLDARSDVFSFGVVLYDLLAGRRPFDAANDLEMLKAIAHATPAPLAASVPEILRIAVDKALEKDPADRYQTMRDFVADLRRVVRKPGSSQTVAPLPSDMQVVVGVVKRNAWLAAGVGAVLVLAVGGAIYVAAPRTLQPVPAVSSPAPRAAYDISQVTTSGDAVAPGISPDGKYVTYTRGSNVVGTGLWVRQIATASDVSIVAPEPGAVITLPTVTPDGAYIDYVRLDTRQPLPTPSLWRVPFLGGTPRKLVESVWSAVAWSPDGRRMAFIRQDVVSGVSSLVVADADTQAERVLATRSGGTYFASLFTLGATIRPAWSPDGKLVAVYELSPAGGSRVVAVDAATGGETFVGSPGPAFPQGLGWLGPTTLVLSEQETFGARSQLWRMTYPDGAVTPLTNDLSSYFGVDLDASRASLVTSKRETRIVVWVGDADGARGADVVPPTPFGSALYSMGWAGDRVVYDGTTGGNPAVLAVGAGGGAPELIGRGSGAVATLDGRTFLYTKGPDGLWKVDAAGRATQLVTGFASSPAVLPDAVAFLSYRSGVQSPWLVPLAGGEPKEITHEFADASGLRVSRDGRRLAFRSNGGWVACELPDCANRRALNERPLFEGAGYRWTPDGRELAYVDAEQTGIWAMPVEGGTAHKIATVGGRGPGRAVRAFDWSSDGKRLAVLHALQTEDIVLLRGLEP